jgi:TonB family protein
MNWVFAAAIVSVWYACFNGSPQTPSALEKQSLLERQAVTETQRVLSSRLDAGLPGIPFLTWFGQVVGPGAGVIWQLSECGGQAEASDSAEDLRACTEANAVLPDGRKVVVMIMVGTFKKGVTGTPAFYYGVIEQRVELSPIRRLRDLPELLRMSGRSGKKRGVALPAAEMPDGRLIVAPASAGRLLTRSNLEMESLSVMDDAPPPPPMKGRSQRSTAGPPPAASGSVMQGMALTKVQPVYPAGAKRFNASGQVEVRITISEAGRVTKAQAISGHPLLRDAAVEAAWKWVFKPTTLNGVPVETQMVISFAFAAPN